MGALRSWLVALLVLAVHGLAVAAALVSEPVAAPQLQTSAPLYGALVSAPAAQGPANEKTPDADMPEPEPEPEREAGPEPEPLAQPEPALPAPAPEAALETAVTEAVTEKEPAHGEQADQAETGPASDGNNQATVIPPRIDASARQNTPPAYPALSRRRGEEGTVLLAIRIDPQGRVVQAQVAESSGFRRLDEAALTAVRRWHYQPAMRAGVAIAWDYRQPVVFSLAD